MKTLELNQMEKVQGGKVSLEQYCRDLIMIMNNNPHTETMQYYYDNFGCAYFEN